MAGLLNKKDNQQNKNSLNNQSTSFEPEEAFNRQSLFTGTDEPVNNKIEKENKPTTGTRIEVDILNDLKALKAIDKADSISEVIQSLKYTREKNMTKDEKREYDFMRKIMR